MNRYLYLMSVGAMLRQANEGDAGGAGMEMPDAEIARKLQVRVIVGNVKRHVPDVGSDGKPDGTITPLFQIYGHASGTKRGETDGRPWVGLTGRFEAVNITPKVNKDTGEVVAGEIDGRVFTGPVAFLPEPMASMLAEQLEATEPELDADKKPVMVNGVPKMRRLVDSLEFAFEIGVKATETPIGYEYTTKPIIKPGGADPLANLRSKVLPNARKALALPAPGNAPALGTDAAQAAAGTKAKGKGK